MANHEAIAPKRRIWLWSFLAICALAAWFLFQLFGPNSPIIVSKKTTVITSPLREDGLPDFQKYWRELGREGVTYENNGAVLFWQAIWPGDLSPEDQLPMREALGFERIPTTVDTLQGPYDKVLREKLTRWLTEQYQQGLTVEESDVLLSDESQGRIGEESVYLLIDNATSKPWTSEQVPVLADWIAANEKPFALLKEATQRLTWWSPSPSLLRDPYAGGIAILLPDIQSVRDAARALWVRAMWHAGESRHIEAWNDLLACFRLARATGEGPTLVGQFVAIALDSITLQQTATLLQEDNLDPAFTRQVLEDLLALKPSSDIVRSIDEGERLLYVDTILMLCQDSDYALAIGLDQSSGPLVEILPRRLDWNLALREGNHWLDRLVDAAQRPTFKERQEAFTTIENELAKIESSLSSPDRVTMAFLSLDARSALVSDGMITLMLGALGSATRAEDRSTANRDLTYVAAALAVYRAEHGDYPEKLDQLAPGILAKVPNDLYSGKPFIYERKSDGGYMLYSVFENGIDDGANSYDGEITGGEWVAKQNEEFDYENSDLVIRVPMPKFALPTPPMLVE